MTQSRFFSCNPLYAPCSNYRVNAMELRFTIGALSAATGTKIETVRYYERIGLLPAPERTSGNYRSYRVEHRDRLSFIRRARALGFTLSQTRTLLDLAEQREQSCAAIDEIAREHLAEVDRKIADLESLRSELGAAIQKCGRGSVAECRIVRKFSVEAPLLRR